MNQNKPSKASAKLKSTQKSDKDQGQDPNSHKWSKWASMATVAGVFVAIVAIVVQHMDNQKDGTSTTSIVIGDTSKQKTPPTVQQTPPPQIKPDNVTVPVSKPGSTIITKTSAPAASAPHAENLWNGQLTNKIKRILSGKGYHNTTTISGSLFLSEPKTIDNERLRYILTLTIDIRLPASKKPCGQLIYSCPITTDAADMKSRIIDQGLEGAGGVIEQLEKETDLPSCIN